MILLISLLTVSAGAQQKPGNGGQEPKPAEQKPADQTTLTGPLGFEFSETPSGNVTLLHAKEDFSALSLSGSDLHAEPPLLGSREQTKSFTRELWRVQWRPNDPIDLYVIRPLGAPKPPVVLYLYGYPTDTERFKDDRYCERVTQNGTAAIGFVSAFTGHRAEHQAPNQWFIGELPEALATTVHDVQMVLNYLDSRGDLDISRVGIFGQGSGGSIAILAAAADSRLKAIDLLDPWGDWPDWLAKTYALQKEDRTPYLKADFLKRLEPLEPVHFFPELKSRSIRMQFVEPYGEPAESVNQLKTAAPPATKTIVYTSVLQFEGAVAGGNLFVWITNELKSPKESKREPKQTAEK